MREREGTTGATFAGACELLEVLSPDPRERGYAFEILVRHVLRSNRRFDGAWLWGDWLGSAERDIGIDIVARRRDDGALVAVQCKDQERINKGDLDSFIANSARAFSGERFAERLVFTTATKWGENAETALKGLDPPVRRRGPDETAALGVDWDAYLADLVTELHRQPGRWERWDPALREREAERELREQAEGTHGEEREGGKALPRAAQREGGKPGLGTGIGVIIGLVLLVVILGLVFGDDGSAVQTDSAPAHSARRCDAGGIPHSPPHSPPHSRADRTRNASGSAVQDLHRAGRRYLLANRRRTRRDDEGNTA